MIVAAEEAIKMTAKHLTINAGEWRDLNRQVGLMHCRVGYAIGTVYILGR
jgi:hypothetical protein